MTKASKMKFRIEILSILSKYHAKKHLALEILKEDLRFFANFEDKEFLAKILISEIVTGDKRYAKFCSSFLLKTLDKENIEKHALKTLKDKKIPDKKKMFLISVLKQKDINFDLHEIENFVNDVEKISKDNLEEFLYNMTNNLEVQIDLLDFYSNVPKEEKLMLLKSLMEDEGMEDIQRVCSLLTNLELSSEEKDIITPVLLSSNSPYLLRGLKNLLTVFDDTEETTKRKIKRKISEINLKNPNFKDLTFVKNTSIYKTLIGSVDGCSNFSLIFSRIDKNDFADTFFVTINIELGVTSCIGFNKIHKKNFEEILSRLFADSPPACIEPKVFVAFLNYYTKKNTQTNTAIPYELNIWSNLVSDVENDIDDLSLYLNSELERVDIKKEKLRKILSSKILNSWFYTKNQNEKSDKIFTLLNKNNICNMEKLEEDILNFIKQEILSDKHSVEIFLSQLLIQGYVIKLLKFKILADYLYSICFSEEYLEIFLNHIFQKSIYHYLLEKSNSSIQKNIFNKEEKLPFTADEMLKTAELIEKRWK